ncbi:N-acetylneuraminate synthase family protein [Geobacter pelophilus]|uniref:N-acetylneuraminate synthase family protein n=1 Tax=Geoanaerobacter pelophilus TaxID=60036 RepID=A0AAW4L2A2_9BACT|nr:N-acetylneuraminate synthase family protein [Geoanaerobacter pelophilus]MBT0663930.1 N-acetylneuraminate synthase family protein [Geoanaerobacter pelophilus]
MGVQFIAEVSSNHSRDLKRCLDFIDCSADIGCDAVKFQLFKIEELFAPEVLSVNEQLRRRKEWELPVSFLSDIAGRCREKNIQFSCTPFYLEAVDELLPFVDFLKIASYELLWNDLLVKCAKTGKPVILSTGMATLDEVSRAVTVLRNAGCLDLTLLHCVSGYPAPVDECNLSVIETLRSATGCSVGWSDHSVSTGVVNRAINRWGACTVEFHLDLDGAGDEFNAGHCWLPEQIASLIADVRTGEGADGDGIKKPSPKELPDRDWRADPEDGLRPLKHVRINYKG